MMKPILLLLLFVLGSLSAYAQEVDSAQTSQPDPTSEPSTPPTPPLEEVYFRLGLFGGYAKNFHETQATLFGSPECGLFQNGVGSGFAAGFLGEIPLPLLDEGMLDGVVMVGFAQRGGTFGEVLTRGLPVLDPNTDTYVDLNRRHAYSADLGFLQSELGIRFTPLPDYPLFVRATWALGIPIVTPTHVQTEEIVSPVGVLYPETNTAIREVSTGEIADVAPMLSVGGALGYILPLGPRLSASPEVGFYYPLGDITPNFRWRVSTAQAGVALRYEFGRAPVPPPPLPPPPPPPPPPPQAPTVVVAAVSAQKIEIEETLVTETFPVLPYIFFDSAASAILPRYRQLSSGETANFSEKNLPHRSLGAYYDLLNVIGSRLVRNPKTLITLNGATDGREQALPADGAKLARARAQAVKEYLVTSWGIDPKRIAVATTSLPTNPSNMDYAEGAEENRRVEIRTSNDEILQPIIFERFSEYAITPRSIPFKLQASSPSGIDRWQLDVYAGGTKVMERSGNGTPPATLAWDLDLETAATVAQALTNGDGELRCELTAIAGNSIGASDQFGQPVNKSLSPFEVSRLSLIVFDFDKSGINTQNRRMVSAFVAQSMQPTSTSTIIGSTDRLGEVDHNQELSTARAVSVRALVVAERPTATITKVEGIGPSRLLYDNDLPEGRYYCRTVTVEVRTPIE